MIKLRVTGTREEIEEFLAGFRPGYRVLSESEPYPNRGSTEYVRVYLDVELVPIAELFRRAGAMLS